jgi:ribbon-helix-helix CopG family protein
MIEEDLDDALGLEAKQQGTSKAALIRRYVRLHLGAPEDGTDALTEMVGIDDFDPSPIDDVVYR